MATDKSGSPRSPLKKSGSVIESPRTPLRSSERKNESLSSLIKQLELQLKRIADSAGNNSLQHLDIVFQVLTAIISKRVTKSTQDSCEKIYYACLNERDFTSFIENHKDDGLIADLAAILALFENYPGLLSVNNFRFILFMIDSAFTVNSFKKYIEESIKKNNLDKALHERVEFYKKIIARVGNDFYLHNGFFKLLTEIILKQESEPNGNNYQQYLTTPALNKFIQDHADDGLIRDSVKIFALFQDCPELLTADNFTSILFIIDSYRRYYPSYTLGALEQFIKKSIDENNLDEKLERKAEFFKRSIELKDELQHRWDEIYRVEQNSLLKNTKRFEKNAITYSSLLLKSAEAPIISKSVAACFDTTIVTKLFKNLRTLLDKCQLFQTDTAPLVNKLNITLDAFICEQYIQTIGVMVESSNYLANGDDLANDIDAEVSENSDDGQIINNESEQSENSSASDNDSERVKKVRKILDFNDSDNSQKYIIIESDKSENAGTNQSDSREELSLDSIDLMYIDLIDDIRGEIVTFFKNNQQLQNHQINKDLKANKEKHTGLKLMYDFIEEESPIQFYKNIRQVCVDREAAGKTFFGFFANKLNRESEPHDFYMALIETPLMVAEGENGVDAFRFNQEGLTELLDKLQQLNSSLEQKYQEKQPKLCIG